MDKIKKQIYRVKWLYYSLSFFRRSLARLWMLLSWSKPVDRNCAVVVNYYGAGFGDNGKAISLELLKKRPEMKIYWAVHDKNVASVPPNMYTVRFRSLKYYSLMARAGIWIDNSRKSRDLIKRKGQLYMQTWHGGVALKQIEKDAEKSLAPNYIKEAKDDSRMADVMLSNSSFCTEMYRRAFWYDGEILECGSPRLDAVFKATEEDREQVRQRLGLPENCRLLLYAPTFRANYCIDCYDIDSSRILRQLGEGWAMAVRLHPNIADSVDDMQYSESVVNATAYPDMYELLSAADIVITDYSSIMFEAAFVGKPVFLYASDVDEYVADRNFYFEFSKLPFPLARTNDEFVAALRDFDRAEYTEKLRAFNAKLGIFEQGDAAKKAVDCILRNMKEIKSR